jgi:type II secretory pathway pseudopilin PulG
VPQIALELLRLLAQDAPAGQLEEQTRALAASDPDTAAAAYELARRVRAGLDAHRRRETELAALVDTARELASRSEPGAVLDAIVRRTRALLGVDVAYLTLYDPERGDTYMRATAGSVSARFQALRLPLGAGLGGLVAQTRRPHWTADYPADNRYRHTSEIDAAVAEEGLEAICGVPLLVDDELVGVLFAANRADRPLRRDEVALLGSLGALAAVSLVQTRRAAETLAALDALSAAHTGVQQAVAAHDRLVELVLAGGGLDDLAAALGELLGCWAVILDAEGSRLAAHGPAPPADVDPDPLAGAPAVLRSAGTGRLADEDGLWAATVHAAGQRLGALVLGGGKPLDAGQGRTVERAAMVTALVLGFRLRAAEADQRVRIDLLADLLGRPIGTDPDGGLVERGRLHGLRLDGPHVLAVCHGDPGRRRSMALAATAGPDSGVLAAEHRETVVVLLPGDDPSGAARALVRRLGGNETAPVTVGASGPVIPVHGLAQAYAEARRTADALVALGLEGRGGSGDDLGFAGLVLGEHADIESYVARMLGPVLSHDARRHSDLLRTVAAYFAAGSSPRRAAAALHVHVNTVGQRLDRVATLLGPDWQEPDRALEIQLALRLHRLRATV